MRIPLDGNLFLGALAVVALASVQTSHALSGTWKNPVGGNWTTGTNWITSIASGVDANAGFTTINLNSDATVIVDGSQVVGSIGFSDIVPSHNWIMNAGAGGSLTLDVASGMPAITVQNQSAAMNVIVAGNKGLMKNGVGTLILSGPNTYTGGTVVNMGTLQVTGANSLQGPTTIDVGATLALNAGGATYLNSLSGGGNIQISPGNGSAQLNGDLSSFTGVLEISAGGIGGKVLFANTAQGNSISSDAKVRVFAGSTLFLGSADTSVSFGAGLELYGIGNSDGFGALRIERGADWGGAITLKSDSSIGTQTGSAGVISGSISESGGSFGVTKQGSRTLILAGENTYSGPTIHNGNGSLCLKNSRALQNSTLLYTGGNLIFDSGVTSRRFLFGGLSGTENIALQDSAITPGPIDLAIGNNNLNTGYSGNLSGSGSIDKVGSGTLTISGMNTYTGSTTVSSGVLRLNMAPNLPANLKIMPLGDSITYGYDGSNAGYRGPLYNLLHPVVSGFRYIGTSIERPGVLPASPVDQRHNEGHSSYKINDISNNLDGFDNTRFLQYGGPERNPNGGHWFDGIPNIRDPMYPDVITMMIGTNDIDNLTDVQTRLHALIAKIVTLRPSAKLLVAKITPLMSAPTAVAGYNTIIGTEVAAFGAAGKQVYLVDMNTGFPANGLIADGVHPNDIGFNFMAGKWYAAIVAACATGEGALPASSPTSVASGAVLDLNGTNATVGNLNGLGDIQLGNGGVLTVNNNGDSSFDGSISGTGKLVKTGNATLTLSGAIDHLGSTQVSGGRLRVSGSFSNSTLIEVMDGGILELCGGRLSASNIHIHAGGVLLGCGEIDGNVVNEGLITASGGRELFFTGQVTNIGIIRMTGGAALSASEILLNHGTLDLMTGAQGLPENLVNDGIVIDASAVRVDSITTSAGPVTVEIRSFTGHVYQLQYSSTLLADSWQNQGGEQNGVTGDILSFSADVAASGDRGFYRIKIDP
ncbi:MAG: autotransporter-associated beta strand repeat-containing protein [Luteolibacter sp.]